ncbi:ATP-grasp domain-containing protein [Metabacillus indicus]|uniref:ATP-grasp domain-containing protein n=1 Tax=Metabacillus indicus TaxID=246786 RepID=UPI0029FF6E4E|nr:ATP-grasp domain-containing protein [Metabacillus indicus]MDX8289725.1 ATP-grasp domain-containing protein [Metabacillus indicus]
MSTYKIWFNRWFSVAYHYIDMIRNNEDGIKFEVYGTHPDADHVMLANCDYSEVEPKFDTDGEYVQYCLDFCRKHGIQLFVPRYKMLPIAKALDKFEELGVKVLVNRDAELLEAIDNKDDFYEICREKGLFDIPSFYTAKTPEEFKDTYEKLKNEGLGVCYKPVVGEGGYGFRIIDDNVDPLKEVMAPSYRIPFQRVYDGLKAAGEFPELMVMEFLEGEEYSIDCLAFNGELIAAVPRRKGGGRIRILENNKELIELAEAFTEEFKLDYIFNIQVKYNQGLPKLLEINPRMSGGLYFSCLSGVNFPYLAVKLLLGEKVEKQETKLDIKATFLEKEIIL